ncbi:lipopolysaccharide assembly protein LapB [Faecalispora jeddahensis]|uniref:tetratricopeptide repeat protein n=1 Tax=Faecalispora jeddahensis TaxID=1414721 RepID=UPI0027B93FC3|nr:tetratricopeptide repeat protein [Faecalispora jeddahensis]
MFCTKCGHRNDDNFKFCEQCGFPLQETAKAALIVPEDSLPLEAPPLPRFNRRVKKTTLIVSVLILLVCGGIGGHFYLADQQKKAEEAAYASQLTLAQQDFDQGKYDDAILDFTSALNKNPQDERPYLGIAQVYQKQQNFDKAINILTTGFSVTKSSQIQDMLEEMTQQKNRYEYQKQLDLAQQYAYAYPENAIQAYKEAERLCPKESEGYIKQAEFYRHLDLSGDNPYFKEAIDALQRGYDNTGSQDLLQRLNEMEKEAQTVLLSLTEPYLSMKTDRTAPTEWFAALEPTCYFHGSKIIEYDNDGHYMLIAEYSFNQETLPNYLRVQYAYVVQDGEVVPYKGQDILNEAYSHYIGGTAGGSDAYLVKSKTDSSYYFMTKNWINDPDVKTVNYCVYQIEQNGLKQIDKWIYKEIYAVDEKTQEGKWTENIDGKPIAETKNKIQDYEEVSFFPDRFYN